MDTQAGGYTRADGIAAIDKALEIDDDEVRPHRNAALFLKGMLLFEEASTLSSNACCQDAVNAYAMVLKSFAEIGHELRSINCLERIFDLVKDSRLTVTAAIALGLGSVALQAEAEFGEKATLLLQEIWERTILALPQCDCADQRLQLMLWLLQLSKGLHFATVLNAGSEEVLKQDDSGYVVKLLSEWPEGAEIDTATQKQSINEKLLLTRFLSFDTSCELQHAISDFRKYRVHFELSLNRHLVRLSQASTQLPFAGCVWESCQITLLVKANMQETWVTALKLRLLAVWMDANLALYPSSIVFLQIPIQQVLQKTLLMRQDVQFPLSLSIWIGEDISYATQINDSPCSDRIDRLNLSVHPTQEPVVRMRFQSASNKQYSPILDLHQ
jgi:hypothetical protein